MEKKDLIEKIQYFIEESNKDMLKNIDKILNSGSIDIDNYDNDFLLPKIIFSALLHETQYQYQPFSEEGKKAVKNIIKCI